MKTLTVLVALIILFVSFTSTTQAALVTKSDNKLEVNVLGAQDSNVLQTVTASVEEIINKISFDIQNNSLVLSYEDSSNSEQKIDLDNFEGEVVEIKKENDSESLYVLSKDNKVLLQQRGIVVATTYPIEIGNSLDNLTLQTNSGNRYLTILPYDAVSPLLKTNMIDELNNEGKVELIELDAGELAYYIQGEKNHNLFELVSLKADVNISVSALNGKILSVDQPTWSRILSFLRV